jgi:hypothetical protein
MRFRKQKPYECPRLRVIPWHENVWLLAKRLGWLLLGIVGTVLSGTASLLTNLSEGSSVTSWDGSGSLDDGDRTDWSSTDADTFEIDDDDMIRGQWDVSSSYYSICHPDYDSSSYD